MIGTLRNHDKVSFNIKSVPFPRIVGANSRNKFVHLFNQKKNYLAQPTWPCFCRERTWSFPSSDPWAPWACCSSCCRRWRRTVGRIDRQPAGFCRSSPAWSLARPSWSLCLEPLFCRASISAFWVFYYSNLERKIKRTFLKL